MGKAIPVKNGFTLIETLVVIAITAVLMAILMPALHMAKDQGKKMVCQSNMRQLGWAHVLYQESYDGFIVPGSTGVNGLWYNVLGPFFKHKPTIHSDSQENIVIMFEDDMGHRILHCPMDKTAYPMMYNPHGENPPPEGWLSYALNSQTTQNLQSRSKKQYAGVGGNKITDIHHPSQVMMHCDFAYRAWVCDALTLTQQWYDSELDAHYDEMQGYPEQNQTIRQAYRHNRRMNILWVDGHVSLLKGKMPSASVRPAFWGHIYDRFPRK